jgi:hypothetical protein
MDTKYPNKLRPATDTKPAHEKPAIAADPFDIEKARERRDATTPQAQAALRRKRMAELAGGKP